MRIKSLLILLILGIALFAGYEKAYADHHIRTQDINDICHTKTDTIRNVPERVKHAVYIRDGVPGGNRTGICDGPEGCEVDHICSLELGCTNDISNLMIQPYFGKCNAHMKDHLENKLHALVCANVITIQEAQTVIYDDWRAAYSKYIDPSGCE
ncbi:MAG: hypothetical protein ACXWAT_00985 [Methylobacter sp.]